MYGRDLYMTPSNNLTVPVPAAGFYRVYFHITLNVSDTSVNVTQNALNMSLVHTNGVIFYKELSLPMQLPTRYYDHIVLFDNIHLVPGTYYMLVSDAAYVHKYRVGTGLAVHQL
jgi:hypothetical protein